MSGYRRYAVYHLPPESAPWADLATRWLGWDAVAGREPQPLDPPPADAVTATPRRYGLHATLKPPFRLAGGQDEAALQSAVAALAAGLAPVSLSGLRIARLGPFLALRPVGDENGLNALAAAVVEGLDTFRAPPSDDELARRRARRLSPRQEANLMAWGYPHVMEDFRFHITLTGRLDAPGLDAAERRLVEIIAPLLPERHDLATLDLLGEDAGGRFHLISRHPLGGAA